MMPSLMLLLTIMKLMMAKVLMVIIDYVNDKINFKKYHEKIRTEHYS